MGRSGVPAYGEDLGSAVETVKSVVAKIETNKYSKKDLVELALAVCEVLKFVVED